VPGGHELSRDDAPDVSGSARYQNLHGAALIKSLRGKPLASATR
jgi:hypothetical protein